MVADLDPYGIGKISFQIIFHIGKRTRRRFDERPGRVIRYVPIGEDETVCRQCFHVPATSNDLTR